MGCSYHVKINCRRLLNTYLTWQIVVLIYDNYVRVSIKLSRLDLTSLILGLTLAG